MHGVGAILPERHAPSKVSVDFDYTSGAKAFDNGTEREPFTFSADAIIRF